VRDADVAAGVYSPVGAGYPLLISPTLSPSTIGAFLPINR